MEDHLHFSCSQMVGKTVQTRAALSCACALVGLEGPQQDTVHQDVAKEQSCWGGLQLLRSPLQRPVNPACEVPIPKPLTIHHWYKTGLQSCTALQQVAPLQLCLAKSWTPQRMAISLLH